MSAGAARPGRVHDHPRGPGGTVYYKTETGMKMCQEEERFPASVGRWLDSAAPTREEQDL